MIPLPSLKNMNTRRERILAALDVFVEQRPGIDPRDYAGYSGYHADRRRATKARSDYWRIRRELEHTPSIYGTDIIRAANSAFSGRLTITDKRKQTKLSYCTGQYWPTEYRLAACAVLASALWNYHRGLCPVEYNSNAPNNESPGAWMRNYFRNVFGQGIQRTWFC